jgi:hypothetical protein
MAAGAICLLASPFSEGDLLDGIRSALRVRKLTLMDVVIHNG